MGIYPQVESDQLQAANGLLTDAMTEMCINKFPQNYEKR